MILLFDSFIVDIDYIHLYNIKVFIINYHEIYMSVCMFVDVNLNLIKKFLLIHCFHL